uniref:ABC transmembrane type-1 domain-containing protein n=1 Tax=Biomphalaria glabrata TaxID=6526 RepID=A0A2C9LV32_BIOGL
MASLSLIFQIIPYFVQVASFGVFIAVDGYLDPSKAFVSISLFNILTSALSMMPMFIPALIQAGVSITRIVGFFRQPDLSPDARTYDPRSEDAIKIENGTFTWDNVMPEPTLKK